MCNGPQLGTGGVVAENTEGPRAEHQIMAFDHGFPNPPRGQAATELTTGEQGHVAAQGRETSDEPIGAEGNLFDCLAAGATISKDVPPGPFLADVRRRLAFVLTVVPLRQIGLHLGRSAQFGQRTGPLRTVCRAGEHVIEPDRPERRSERAGQFLVVGSQRYVRVSRVLYEQRPLGLAMADEEEPERRRVHAI